MILYALKIHGEYIRDLKEQGWACAAVNKASVFGSADSAGELARKVSSDTGEAVTLVRMTLTEEEIPWP